MLHTAAQHVQGAAKWRDMFIIATVTPSPLTAHHSTLTLTLTPTRWDRSPSAL